MRDKPVIVMGLVIVVAILTVPFWYALASGQSGTSPEVHLPPGRCVEDLPYMKAHHMDLLEQWRDAVVREGRKTYLSKAYGDRYEMSLTKTCLKCHESRQTFCYQCHSYANVHPSCWDCHAESNGK